MADVRTALRAGWFHDPAGLEVAAAGWGVRRRAADEDAGGRGAGSDAASSGGECLPGLGLAIAVPTAVGAHTPPTQVARERFTAVAADRARAGWR